MSWDERPSWFVWRAELSSGGPRFVLRFLRRRPQRIPRTEDRSELELIAGVVHVVLERVCVRRHHCLRLPKPIADSMQAIDPALRCPTFFLGDRPVAFPRLSVGARRVHAARYASTGAGGRSPAPAGNAPTPPRAWGLAIGARRGRAWRAKSPSADPCIATQLRAEGPGSSNAEGVPTSALLLLLINNVDDSCP